jgi:hypothetical protein
MSREHRALLARFAPIVVAVVIGLVLGAACTGPVVRSFTDFSSSPFAVFAAMT